MILRNIFQNCFDRAIVSSHCAEVPQERTAKIVLATVSIRRNGKQASTVAEEQDKDIFIILSDAYGRRQFG
jgi:hypothetical protein